MAVAVAIALGLASRRYHHVLPESWGKYPGDVLWAAMIFFGLGALVPRSPTLRLTWVALALCLAVELLKLYQAPWIVSFRRTTPEHLIFGQVFSMENLVAYLGGVGLALGLELVWFRRRNQLMPHDPIPFSRDPTGKIGTQLSVIVQRDSVCAGDDGDAPHEQKFVFAAGITVADALQQIRDHRYLASIAGGKATWTARGKKTLAVLAQEWPEARLIVDANARLAEHLDDNGMLYFSYLTQTSPELVFERARNGTESRR